MKGDLSVQEEIEEFGGIAIAYRNFAQRLRGEYINDFGDLVEFLEKKGVRYVTDVGLSDLVRNMAELEKRGYADSTRRCNTVSIKLFFSILYLDSHISTNVAK